MEGGGLVISFLLEVVLAALAGVTYYLTVALLNLAVALTSMEIH
jgi:hypothetical protein